ncbi:hypothetical protein SARC_14861 [Sphaeroforma arctica JP610]|uniref:RGS domain-containing protein n=1 Tax=Sphaeroforma arctica JP610 TaxID=667725 RepID=A0A0L0F7Q7_9EUKA|nr:hypothetical protein SARC_14861 [Sphaeroforma arctica JP610]KNC72581.1 hypothetical protein SARC_14861 [Sphaeroforma arctica JP610]|eukprot:XP_014146483.1 hypothetical protein SARC_14861 [Sphaeroforma arctica JP610]
MFAESYGLIILGAALLARLRVMYLVFRKGDFDVQYKKVVLRVVFCAVLPSLCVFMIYLPEKYFFIAGLILRLLLVSVILETIYYCVRLRKTKYLRDQYVGLLTTCGISIVSILYLAIILPNLNSSVRVIDHFNAIMVVVWVFNVELIGPSVYQTFVAHLHRNNHINYDNVSLSLVINKRSKRTGLQTVLDDDRLYPTLLKIAQERYCEENVLFLHDGKLLYNSLKMYQTEADAQKQACEATPVSTDDNQSPARKIELVRTTIHDCSRSETCKKQEENVRVSTRDTHSTVDESPGDTGVVSDHCTPRLVTELYQFLDKYVMRSAPTPVNLASSQISVLRQARSFDRLSRNDADNIMNVLVLSLADVEILFESSGVLAKFERTSAITGICAEREAVIRLGIETREELQ